MENQPWKILLIEDDEDDYIMTRSQLLEYRRGPIEMKWASSYEEGQRLIKIENPDIILVDYYLGPYNGLSLIRDNLSQGIRTPFILLTGLGDYDLDLEAMRAGAVEYLNKREITPALLERTIRYAIERKRSEEKIYNSLRNLEFLSTSATHFLESDSDTRLHPEMAMQFVSSQLYLLDPVDIFLVSEYDGGNHSIILRAIACQPVHLEKIINILGNDPTGLILKFDEANTSKYIMGKLEQVPGGLFELAFEQIPRPICEELENQLHLGDIFVMPFVSGNDFLGSVALLTHRRGLPENAQTIEAFVNQASMALKRIRTEADLQKARQELEQRVLERTQELSEAVEQLRVENKERVRVEKLLRQNAIQLEKSLDQEKTMRRQLIQAEKHTAMSRMIASIAHELNNPIQTIQNCLYLAEQELPPNSQIHEYMFMGMSEARRIARLVQQLREIYRPLQPAAQAPISVISLLGEIQVLLAPHLQHEKVVWQQAVETTDSYVVYGIEDQLKEVLLNISMNAIEAMAPNGGVLEVSLQGNEQNEVGICLKDNGPGIPPENLIKIFEPFFTTKSNGTGLGLSICYEIVQSHNGHLTTESQLGNGAAFTIWLPLYTGSSNEE